MVENSIRKFASENLSDDYIPVVHGQTRSLKPLILMVKQKRDLWKLPFAETELRILAGLGEYVTEGKKEEFEEITASTFKSEKVEIEREEEETAFRYTTILSHVLVKEMFENKKGLIIRMNRSDF